MIDYQRFFPHVLEFSLLLQRYHNAAAAEKSALWQQIMTSDYMAEVAQSQTLVAPVPGDNAASKWATNKLRKDIFINMAVPGPEHPEQASIGGMSYHRHDYFELVYVARGGYAQYLNGVCHHQREGELCLISPNVVHRDAVSAQNDVVLFFCLSTAYVRNDLARAFAPHRALQSFMTDHLKQHEIEYILFTPGNEEKVEQLLGSILEENMEKQPGHHAIIQGYLVRLFNLLLSDGTYRVSYQSAVEEQAALTAEILRYLKSHLTETGREQAAAYFHFSPAYFNRLLVRRTGKCYSEQMRDLRLDAAAEALDRPDQSVNTIIRGLGFSNKGYFNRIFKEKYGMLPGEYRNR